MTDTQRIQSELDEAARLAAALRDDESVAIRISEAAALCADSVRSGGKIMAIGNGGSCADAVHFCEELTGRYRDERDPIPAIACADAGHLTCTANDYGYDAVFARWIEALGREGDVLVALSTSGNSPNVVNACSIARDKGVRVFTLLGRGGGELAGAGDVEWTVPGETADRIQELHMIILHALVGAIEHALRARTLT